MNGESGVEVFLTAADLRAWREEQAALLVLIKAKQEELALISRRIELAEQLLALIKNPPDLKFDSVTSISNAMDNNGTPQYPTGAELVRSAIEIVLKYSQRYKKTDYIRRQVRTDPRVRALLDANPNQLYSVMHRMVKAGKLTRTGRGYRLPEPSVDGGVGISHLSDPVSSCASAESHPQL